MATYLRENGGSETGNDTTSEGDTKLLRASEVGTLRCGHLAIDELCAALIDGELSNSVRDLLEEDWDEAGVETCQALCRYEFGKGRNEAVSILRSVKPDMASYLGVRN